jgi:hypothetical protein
MENYKSYETSVILDEIIGKDLEQWIDFITEAVGAPLLMDVSYRVDRIDSYGQLVIFVEGDASMQNESDLEDEEA